MNNSRRHFLACGLGAAAIASLPTGLLFASEASKPCSLFQGVQIGTITYSYRSKPCTADKVLSYAIESGISSIELMGDTAESFAGFSGGDRGEWRKTASMAKYEELRKIYADAGVGIHIVKFGDIGDVSDEQNDYYFRVAEALGAKGITREISDGAAKRIAPMADKYKIYVGFHNHTQINAQTYDGPILSYGKYLAINFDIGHYVASNVDDPLAFVEKYHDRILSVHLKDRTRASNGAKNLPFGQGDTPIKELLHLMRDKGYKFPLDIELEYGVPRGSDAVAEVGKCVAFCKAALE